MPFGWTEAIGIGSALLGFKGQRDANKANQSNFESNLAFQREAAKNAHQWEVEDMRKAGLNPILSATGGKGASPAGGSSLPDIKNPISNAMQAKLINAQIDKMKAEKENVQANTDVQKTQVPINEKQIEKIESEIEQLKSSSNLNDHQSRLINKQIPKVIAETYESATRADNNISSTQLNNVRSVVSQLEGQAKEVALKEAKMKLQILEGPAGHNILHNQLNKGASIFGTIHSSAGQGAELMKKIYTTIVNTLEK